MKYRYLTSMAIIVLVVAAASLYMTHIHRSRKVSTSQTSTINHQQKNALPAKSSVDHIVIVLMENKSYNQIVGSANAPYINSLIHKYSFADNYFAVAHPSLPNYIALIGGNTFGITSDCTDCYINASNLIDQLTTVHKSWKAYMESLPSACYIGSAAPYAQKHDPFIYFDDIRTNPTRCKQIVPYAQLSNDLKTTQTTPDFVWITPNLCDDMHDCSVSTGDTWLAKQIPQILNAPAFTKQHSLLVITWDEGESGDTNQIPTIFAGNTVKQSFTTHTLYTHYALLHTIESLWNLPPLTTNTAQSPVMTDIFNN